MTNTVNARTMTSSRRLKALLTGSALAAGLFAAAPAHADDYAVWSVDHYESGTSASVTGQSQGYVQFTGNTSTVIAVLGQKNIGALGHVDIQNTPLWVAKGQGADPMAILGRLTSSGRVVVMDNNGVFFGPDSYVDVGGLLATSGNIGNDQFLNNPWGQYTIDNVGAGGAIELNGMINVADAGLAAFVAPSVVNNGIISAKLGKVAFASGEEVTLDLYGDQLVEIAVDDKVADALLENNGTINAEGGTVLMTAQAAKEAVDDVINMNGVINVASATQVGGKIVLSGGAQGKVKVTGMADASGKTGGGAVAVKGETVEVTETGLLLANAAETGNGGTIDAIADGNMLFSGSALARGGAVSGNGGAVEVSGYEGLGFDGYVSTSAANGEAGTFLLDPSVAIIHSGWLDPIGWLQLIIKAENLANAMHENKTVTVQADNSIEVGTDIFGLGNGNIVLNEYDYTRLEQTGTKKTCIGPICWNTPIYGLKNYAGTDNPGNLILDSNTVNFNKDLIMGTGTLQIKAGTINLDGRIYGSDGGTPVLFNDAQLTSTANTVNIKSNKGLIQQGIDLIDSDGTVNVAAGLYNETLTINDANVNLRGAKADIDATAAGRGTGETIIAPNSPGVYITAAGATINGFTITGADHGIHAEFSGSGAATTIKNNIITGSTQNGIQGSTWHNQIIITNNLIDGANGHGIGLTGNHPGSIIADNTVQNTKADGINIWNTSNGTQILRNKVAGVTGSGIVVDGSQAVLVQDNEVTVTGAYGIFARDGMSGITIDSNLVNTTGRDGIHVDNMRHVFGSMATVISGNVIGFTDMTATTSAGDGNIGYAFGGDGIVLSQSVLENGRSATISGNTVADATNGISVTNGSHTVLINDNKIGTVSAVANTGIKASDSKNLTITANEIAGGKTGIALSNVATATVGGDTLAKGNIIRNIENGWGNSGINVFRGSALTVRYNDLDNVMGHGIVAENVWGSAADGLIIADNDIDTARFGGVYVKFWNGAMVNNNTVDNVTEGHGVNLELTTDASVYANTILNTAGNGINLHYGNTDAEIDGNTVVGARVGIFVDDFAGNNTGTDITANKVSQTVAEGILALRGTDKIRGNVVHTTGADGIEVRNSAGVAVRGNIVGMRETAPGVYALVGDNNVKGEGILVEGSAGAQVHGNEVIHATGNGIRVNNSNGATIGTAAGTDRNYISGVDLDGIKVSYGENVTVENNSVYDAKRVGIYAEHATGLNVLGNVVTYTTHGIGTPYGGITADWGYSITISNNTVTGSGHGVMLYQNSGKNTVSGNVIHGVSTNGVNANEVAGLTVSGNFIGFTNKTGTLGAPNNIGNAGININASANADVIGNDIATARHGVIANAANGLDVFDNDITGRGSNTGTGVTITNSSNVNVGDYDQYKWLIIKTADRDNRINSFETGVSITGGTQNNVVNNTVGNVHYGVKLSGTTYADVLDNTLNGNSVTGVDITGGSHFATVQGNDIANFATGINVNGSNDVVIGGWDVATLGTALFLGNNITNAVNGIVANNAQRIDIFGNRIVNGTAGGNGSGITITGSHDADIGGDGNWLVTRLKSNYITGFRDGIQSNASDRANIVRNTVEDSRRDGIRVDRGDEVSVRNNKVEDVGSTGIWLNRLTDATASGNRIDGTGLSGIRAEGSGSNGVDIVDNRIDNTGTNGIAAVGVANLTVDGNRIGRDGGNIGADGINVQSSAAAQITDNQITHTGKNGIAVTGSAKTLIDGNRVGTQAGANNINGDGIVLRASNGTTITGNKVANTTSTGADVGNGISVFTSNEVTIGGPTSAERNTISNAAWDGIRIHGGYGHTVENNKIDVVERVGIWVKNVSDTLLNDNRIDDTGLSGIRAEGGYGVTIEANHADNTGTHGISADTVGDLNVFGNFIGLKDGSIIDGNGIDVVNSDYVEIDGNQVKNAGNGIALREGRYAYVTGNAVTDNRYDGLNVEDHGGELIITGNNFSDNDDDGIDIGSTTGYILIDDNAINDNGQDGVKVTYGPAYNDYDDEYSEDEGTQYLRVLAFEGEESSSVDEVNTLVITNNTIDNNGDDGVDVSGEGSYYSYPDSKSAKALVSAYASEGQDEINVNITIANNKSISGNGDNGIIVSNNALSTQVIGNLISNNGSRGLFMAGPMNGSIVLSGNSFTNNPIGAEFQSGMIDLTGATNRFVGGEVALRFAPSETGYWTEGHYEFTDEGEGEGLEWVEGGWVNTGFAPMTLVNDTIGAQYFEGQSRYYVELDNGAFFNPGTPTILNALDSTYATPYGTFTPSTTGGALSLDQFLWLESKFFHFADRNDLGLFFFGFVPESTLVNIDQERLFNRFANFEGLPGQFSITLTGMPNLTPGGRSLGSLLNAITPAAGNSTDPNALNAIAPAAGPGTTRTASNNTGNSGQQEEASCWSDAVNNASNGVTTTVNYTTGPDAMLNSAADCGGI